MIINDKGEYIEVTNHTSDGYRFLNFKVFKLDTSWYYYHQYSCDLELVKMIEKVYKLGRKYNGMEDPTNDDVKELMSDICFWIKKIQDHKKEPITIYSFQGQHFVTKYPHIHEWSGNVEIYEGVKAVTEYDYTRGKEVFKEVNLKEEN